MVLLKFKPGELNINNVEKNPAFRGFQDLPSTILNFYLQLMVVHNLALSKCI